ncbi:uncharacterized protein LOC128072728 [Tympanuchus pallidicinctus]|uniref:uncharacterized protein LOC128072727 n=1 Tax=Tympanuchus pallidicinctus TaxID=109042 RepID=UPI002286D08B|nr:uncharacterized protein LOC128072727 [Tympanuchus pallidicinctus]XP_052522786.1 uncharacterized protein LOC128072728 [Tympanuchus pallidicinctus]
MKLILTPTLIVALATLSFIWDGFGCSSSLGCAWHTYKKLVLPEEQLTVDTQCQASSWPCWRGLWPCHGWGSFMFGRAIFTEDQKQQPLGTEQKAFVGPFWSGLSMYRIQIWERVINMVLPEKKQQPVIAAEQASNGPCWLGLSSCPTWLQYGVSRAGGRQSPKQQPLRMEQKAFKGPFQPGLSTYPMRIWERVKKMVLPEEQLPVVPEHQHSSCPCRLGVFPCLTWIRSRVSKAGVTQGPKQQTLYTKLKALSLPYPLGLLWDYLAQAGKTWLVTHCLTDVCILCLLSIARSLWRKVRRPQEQGTGQMDSASTGTDISQGEAMHYYDELCEMKSLLLLMDRYVTILQKKSNCQCQRKKEQ